MRVQRKQTNSPLSRTAADQARQREKSLQPLSFQPPPFKFTGSPVQRSNDPSTSQNELEEKSFDELWTEFDHARMSMFSNIPNLGPDPTALAIVLVRKMNQQQARKYGLELYLWLETMSLAEEAREALRQFEASWENAEPGEISENFDWGDRRKPEHLLSFAEQAYNQDHLSNCTSLLRAALSIAQFQYQQILSATQGGNPAKQEAYAGDLEAVKKNICRIYSFYDWKAVYESRLEHSEKLPYLLGESAKVQEMLTLPDALSNCSPDETTVPEPVQTPQESQTNTPAPKTPQHTEPSQTPAPKPKEEAQPSTPEYKGGDPEVTNKDDKGITLKVNLSLPKKTLIGNKKLGRFIDLDSLDLGGVIEIQITLFGNKKADDQTTLAEIEVDGKKKLVGIKKEMEQKLWEAAETNGSSFNIKAKEGLAVNKESGEVTLGVEADFWGAGSFGLTFKLVDVDSGTVNVGVLAAKGTGSPVVILKHLGLDLNKEVHSLASPVFSNLKNVQVYPKFFVEAKFSPNYTEILKELGKRGVKWAARAAARAGVVEGIGVGLGAITAAEIATLGVAAGGTALTIASLYLSLDDDKRMWAAIGDAKRSCKDFRLGFLSALGYPTASVSRNAIFFKDGQRAGAAWFAQSVQNMIAKKGTAEYDLAQEGTSAQDIREVVKLKITSTYEQSQMYQTIGMYTGVAEHQIKEIHIKAWKEALGWRRDAVSYKYEERIIRTHLFPKFDIHGKPVY